MTPYQEVDIDPDGDFPLPSFGTKQVKNPKKARENGTQGNKEVGVTERHEDRPRYVPMSLIVELHDKEFVRNGRDAANFIEKVLPNQLKESFLGLYLDSRNGLIHAELIAVGSLTASIIHPREVFKPAILCSAASIVVLHNHPSGDPSPSEADISVTRKLVEAGKLLGIELVDHVITGANGSFLSMAREGLL